MVSSSFSGASRKGIAFEAFIVTVDATGVGARETADPAKAERLITGAAATKAYMMAKREGAGGREGKNQRGSGEREGRGREDDENAVVEQGVMVAVALVGAADVKRRARKGGIRKDDGRSFGRPARS